ncbi:DUF1749-domain-containing protein [Coniochaeta hoffmannii]|uniref:DUF1749-domain-containing protein n=1 Tax=Coniochaeta hoffmannii TaxID=91930 RepID=A0AA38S1V5_9PEZI|nr:DUF1749-domain-containing protein [Coniochaeta hoffmannii]
MSTPAPIFPVLAHDYNSTLVQHACIYELIPPDTLSSPPSSTPDVPKKKHALVFIGGLGDGPHTVPVIRAVAGLMGEQLPEWADVVEIGEVVSYLRRQLGRSKVVLMGHSTGCQDCMEYVTKRHDAPEVDGIILQGPVSGREGLVPLLEQDERDYEASLAHAKRLVEEGKGDDEYMPRSLLPVGWNNPVTAYRWLSLASVGGDDDYFSSDLPDERVAEIWGGIEAKVLIVPSEKDEHVPRHIDVPKLVGRWTAACKPGVASKLSGLIVGANHRVEYPEGQQWLAERVVRFLREDIVTSGEGREG